MQKISPCLWFDSNAEQAVAFYTSVFRNSSIGQILHYGEAGPGEKGSVLTIAFQLEGQDFMALNGGPHFSFTPAISLMVDCKDQAEIDELWDKLTEGGQEEQCGWLKDKFGVSWQIVPAELDELFNSPDAARVASMTRAMLQMVKLDIAALKQAYADG